MKNPAIITSLLLVTLQWFSATISTSQAWAQPRVWDGTVQKNLNGNGTKENPYRLETAEEFAYLIQNFDKNLSICSHRHFVLNCDIDMQGKPLSFSTTNSSRRSFTSVLDGQGHKISNVVATIDDQLGEYYVGLFPLMGGDENFTSVIRNLEIDGIRFVHNTSLPNNQVNYNASIGGLVGKMGNNSRIENCIVRGFELCNPSKELNLPKSATLNASPIVGKMEEGAELIASYGAGKISASNIVGTSNLAETQGEKVEEHDGYKWYQIADNQYSFKPVDVEITPVGNANDFTYEAKADTQGKTYTYRWSVNGKPGNTSAPTIKVAPKQIMQTLAVELLDGEKVVGCDAFRIDNERYRIETNKVTRIGNTYTVATQIKTESGQLAKESDFRFQWFDASHDYKEVGSSGTLTGAMNNNTYILLAQHRLNKNLELTMVQTFCQPIYVCNQGISEEEASRYTTDGKSYKKGNDANDGRTPETAVRTLRRAYELLRPVTQGGKQANNVIVIMGDYADNAFTAHFDSKRLKLNPDYFEKNKPALITGQLNNFHSGRLLMAGRDIYLNEETCFTQLTFYGTTEQPLANIFACCNNLAMGSGLKMEGYAPIDYARGLIEGTYAPNFNLYGGWENLDDASYKFPENYIHLESGYYGRVIAGGSSQLATEKTGSVSGSPFSPMRTTILCNIANGNNANQYQFDVALIVGGQTNGSCFANNTIEVKGTTTVGRIVGGNIGSGRKSSIVDQKGRIQERPSDSFFGQTTINIKEGTVNEIYGCSLGRFGHRMYKTEVEERDSCGIYFYGRSNINISGGTIANSIYGAGGGSVAGLNYNDSLHSFDPLAPYILSSGKTVGYGPYSKAHGHMPLMSVGGDSLLDLNKTVITFNISDKALLLGSVYGGGNAFSNQLPTHQACSQSGNLYGETHINITGGVIKGYVHGGGSGTLCYFDNDDGSGFSSDRNRFSRLAQTFGSTYVNISGGDIYGMVYGGGEGTYYRATSPEDPTNICGDMGAVFGTTHITVTGTPRLRQSIFGAGNYANVIRTGKDPAEAGSTYVTIAGGLIGGSVYAGGHGHYDSEHPERSVFSTIYGDTHLKVTDGEFYNNPEANKFYGETCNGLFGSGLTTSVVKGDTWLTINHSLYTSKMLSEAGYQPWSNKKSFERRFMYCGGGYGPHTDVYGDTHLLIDVQGAPDINLETLSDGSGDRGQIETKSVLFMDVYGGGMTGNVYGSTDVTVKGNVFIRNLFGGGLTGDCGVRDKHLNGNPYEVDNSIRKYTTCCNVNVFSGGIGRLFGGGQLGNVCGETYVNIGSQSDPALNKNILIEELYGGNDLTGSIAGGNNANYGSNINIFGGTMLVVYGSGNGQSKDYDNPMSKTKLSSVFGMPRPHVASTSISISGLNAENRTEIREFLYCGGNNTTVGVFRLAENNRPEYNMLREELIPNTGRIRLNVGSHVKIANLVMGNNGRRLMEFAPSYTLDGKEWFHGFENDTDFRRYCRHVDVSCVPDLTFNADNEFHNIYKIDDRMNTGEVFNTPNEMDAKDIEIDTFVGGAHAGSMTGDSLYQYTLPPGVLITDKVVGGCMNSTFTYTQRQGPNKGEKFRFAGGMRPYRKMEEARKEQRIQLNLFCKFDPVRYRLDQSGRPSHDGTKVFGGCLDQGVIVGVSVVNLHSNMIDNPQEIDSGALLAAGNEWNSTAAQVFGAGKGERTEVIGDTYVSLRGATFNGIKCLPMVIRAFGGGEKGNVVGRSNVYVNVQCPGTTLKSATSYSVWGGIYGGGLNGNVMNKSNYFPELPDPERTGSHVRVWSGIINNVFGGARNGNVEGASFVDIDDRGLNHFHTIIRNVYGGNDLSGTIGHGSIPRQDGSEFISTNTYVRVHAKKGPDGSYNGFPLIAELYGGGNGQYGTFDKETRKYTSGKIDITNGQTLDITGLSLPNVDTTYVEVYGGTIWGLYGGANCSFVDKATTLDIHYNDDPDAIQEPCCFSRLASESCYKRGCNVASGFGAYGGVVDDGSAIYAENHIRYLFGGNKNTDMTIQPTWKLTGGHIRDLYGGCNLSDVHYTAEKEGDNGLLLDINSSKLYVDNVYGGCRVGNVWSKSQFGTVVNVKDGNIGRIFGGNDISGSIENGAHLKIEGGIIGQVYGSGNGEYVYFCDEKAEQVYTDFDHETTHFICHVPAIKGMNVIEKIKAINQVRPNIDRVMIEIGGTNDEEGRRRTVYVSDAVFAGGNCATVVGKDGTPGDIQLQVNDYSVINSLYLGSNGKLHRERDYLISLLKANNVTKQEAQMRDSEGKGILAYHMDGVTMHGLPTDFRFNRQYDRCYIGSFFVGGANSSIVTHGSVDIVFPRTLNIFNKIVGGSDRARVDIPVESGVEFYDGGILWDGIGEQPTINLDVQCRFLNREMVMEPRYKESFYLRRLTEAEGIFNSGARVYGGCFLSGKVEGEVNVQLSTDE